MKQNNDVVTMPSSPHNCLILFLYSIVIVQLLIDSSNKPGLFFIIYFHPIPLVFNEIISFGASQLID
eukprot:m.24522 g.24522  ORF g.24522 m.24522 type:complete len:67 (+) comp9117_c2_seq2:484-684(+)